MVLVPGINWQVPSEERVVSSGHGLTVVFGFSVGAIAGQSANSHRGPLLLTYKPLGHCLASWVQDIWVMSEVLKKDKGLLKEYPHCLVTKE